MLNDKDLHRHIAGIVAALKAGGFTAHLNHDPEQYKACVAGIEGYTLSMPLDTAFVDISGRFLWLQIKDEQNRPICIEAARSFRAPRLLGGLNRLLASGKLFATKQRILPALHRLPVINLSGHLAYMGGAFVAHQHRDRGVMSLTAQLTMLHLLRCYPLDHLFGLVRPQHVGRSLRMRGYGFTSATLVSSAYWADSAAPEPLFMISADRAALLERIAGPAHYELSPPVAAGAAG